MNYDNEEKHSIKNFIKWGQIKYKILSVFQGKVRKVRKISYNQTYSIFCIFILIFFIANNHSFQSLAIVFACENSIILPIIQFLNCYFSLRVFLFLLILFSNSFHCLIFSLYFYFCLLSSIRRAQTSPSTTYNLAVSSAQSFFHASLASSTLSSLYSTLITFCSVCTSTYVFSLRKRLLLTALLFLSSEISYQSSRQFFSRLSSDLRRSQCFLWQVRSSSSSSLSSLCRITSIIFMEQSLTSSIFRFARYTLFLRLSSRSLIAALPSSNLSFLKLQSKLASNSQLTPLKFWYTSGCSREANISASLVTLYRESVYSCTSPSVWSMSCSASRCTSFSRMSIFLRNSLMSFSFFMMSSDSPTTLPASRKGALSNLSTRNPTSSMVSTLMEWSRWSFLQAAQKTLKLSGQQRFMQMQPLTATLGPAFSHLPCFSQIKNDIQYNPLATPINHNKQLRLLG